MSGEMLIRIEPKTEAEQVKTVYVDGHKVTVHYSTRNNPGAAKQIKEILLSGISGRKL